MCLRILTCSCIAFWLAAKTAAGTTCYNISLWLREYELYTEMSSVLGAAAAVQVCSAAPASFCI
jgi:hypothetical protein